MAVAKLVNIVFVTFLHQSVTENEGCILCIFFAKGLEMSIVMKHNGSSGLKRFTVRCSLPRNWLFSLLKMCHSPCQIDEFPY